MYDTHGTILEDTPTVALEPFECQTLWQPWKRALILKLIGRNISLKQRLQDLWCFRWGFELVDLDGGYFIVRFYSKVNYDHALSQGPWITSGHYLTIIKWRPNFDPLTAMISSTSVWVHFPNLPIEFFNEEVLRRIGNLIGHTVKIDPTTISTARCKFARCTSISISLLLLFHGLLSWVANLL